MKVFALVNTAAGSVGPDGKNRMLRMLSRSGISADVVVFDPESAASQVQSLLAKTPDLLVVWGGDGTHRTALSMAGVGSDSLVLLPGGTMNLLTKWIHGDKPWDIILQSIIARRARRTLDAGRVDDALFFCAMIAGAPAQFALAREDVRAGDFGKALRDTGLALETAGHLHLKAHTGLGADLPAANVVAAMVGPLSRSRGMEVAGLDVPSPAAALGLAWSSLRSGWRNLKAVDIQITQTLTVADPDGRTIPVIMDGEQIDLGARFTAHYAETAAACLVAA